jgi:membrane-bound lytic murein transglycosylase A
MRLHSTHRGRLARWSAAAVLVALAACTSAPPRQEAPITRDQSRWVPVDWQELPGWNGDRVSAAWPALVSSCARPAQDWAKLCASVQHDPPRSDAHAREWLMKHLQPYRVESPDGKAGGLITGYYEPMVEAQRKPAGRFRVALYSPPPDLATRRRRRSTAAKSPTSPIH